MAKKKNWTKSAFGDMKEGALTKMGWPDAAKLVNAARSNRKTVVQRLLLLANGSADPATKAKARSIIKRIQSELGKS